MKQASILLSAFIVTILTFSLQAQVKVVERPAFELWSSTTIEIDKIEITDTETIVHIDAFYRPNNWIKIISETYIRESGKNEKLMIIKSEGIDLDKEFYMPESGQTSFKLTFPAISKSVAKIDFMEGDCDGCFNIWGIYLDGKKPVPAKLPKTELVAGANKMFPKPEIKKGTAILSGQIIGNLPEEMLSQSMTTYIGNIITGESEEYKIPIGKDGKFRVEIPIVSPIVTYVSSSFYRGRIYLVPQETTELYIDAGGISRAQSRYHRNSEESSEHLKSVHLIGPLNLSASDLNHLDMLYTLLNRRKIIEEAYDMSPENYKTFIFQKMSDCIQTINKTETMSQSMQDIMVRNAKLYILDQLLSYSENLRISYMLKNNIERKDMDKMEYSPQTPDKSYYSFLKDFDLNNPNYIFSSDYSRIVSSIIGIKAFGISDETASIPIWLESVKKELAPTIGSNSGIFYDLAAAGRYAKLSNDMKLFTDTQKAELNTIFTNKTIVNELLAENDKTIKVAEESKKATGVNVYDVPKDVAQDKVFDAILSKYKGKVIFVDFWATWCGPCRSAMKTAKPVKEEFAGKDVVFLYLTNSSSPMKAWRKMIPDIDGDHYRIEDDKLWDYWSKTFNITGIPLYFIYDKEGKQTQRSSGFMGIEKMKEWLQESL